MLEPIGHLSRVSSILRLIQDAALATLLLLMVALIASVIAWTARASGICGPGT